MNHDHRNLGSTLGTRATLLFRIRDPQDDVSWCEFHRLYRRLIYGRARRAGLSREDAEDVAQEVFKRVAETIAGFDLNPERGSFRGWLMQLTRWRIADTFERGGRLPMAESPRRVDGDTPRTPTMERVPMPAEEDEWDREWREHVLSLAFERLARGSKPRDVQVFDLYVRQRWPALRVARELGVNPASVYVIAFRLKRRLASELRRLFQQVG